MLSFTESRRLLQNTLNVAFYNNIRDYTTSSFNITEVTASLKVYN